jgi:hypothetical protein
VAVSCVFTRAYIHVHASRHYTSVLLVAQLTLFPSHSFEYERIVSLANAPEELELYYEALITKGVLPGTDTVVCAGHAGWVLAIALALRGFKTVFVARRDVFLEVHKRAKSARILGVLVCGFVCRTCGVLMRMMDVQFVVQRCIDASNLGHMVKPCTLDNLRYTFNIKALVWEMYGPTASLWDVFVELVRVQASIIACLFLRCMPLVHLHCLLHLILLLCRLLA